MSKKNYNPKQMELSYFRLSLFSYLKDSHPDKASDQNFIAARGDSAAESYSEAIKQGLNHTQASEIVNEVLYKGLHFSPFETTVEIIIEEFSDIVPSELSLEVAKILFPVCLPIVNKYELNDDFANSSEYQEFYTELVGRIDFLLDGI